MNLKTFLVNNGIIKEQVAINFLVNPKFLWTSFGIILILFAIVSLILIYHWITYGYKPLTTGFMTALYLAVSLIIFSVILITLLAYSIPV